MTPEPKQKNFAKISTCSNNQQLTPGEKQVIAGQRIINGLVSGDQRRFGDFPG